MWRGRCRGLWGWCSLAQCMPRSCPQVAETSHILNEQITQIVTNCYRLSQLQTFLRWISGTLGWGWGWGMQPWVPATKSTPINKITDIFILYRYGIEDRKNCYEAHLKDEALTLISLFFESRFNACGALKFHYVFWYICFEIKLYCLDVESAMF